MAKGIIVRIDWNENKWEKPSDSLELANNFEYVKDLRYTLLASAFNELALIKSVVFNFKVSNESTTVLL